MDVFFLFVFLANEIKMFDIGSNHFDFHSDLTLMVAFQVRYVRLI